MRKISTPLTRKHLNAASVVLLAIAGILFTSSPASAQTTAPLKFVSHIPYQADVIKEVAQSPEAVKGEGEDILVTVSVSPNPTTDKFLVSLKGNKEDRVRVKVTDKHGCVIDNHEVPGQANLQLGFWYYPGTYQLHVTQNGNTKTIKLEKRID